MKRKSVKFNVIVGAIILFAAYFALSLSCASTSNLKAENIARLDLITTENSQAIYDITLVSTPACPSRIHKLVSKSNSEVLFAISPVLPKASSSGVSSSTTTAGTLKRETPVVTAGELNGQLLISQEDAKKAVDFISEVQKDFATGRKGDGVLKEFVIREVYDEPVWISESSTSGLGHYETITKRRKVFWIQHQTTNGKDEIIYCPAVYLEPVFVSMDEIAALKDALSK